MKQYSLSAMTVCVAGALLITATATPGLSKPRNGDVVVTGPKFDPVTQRRVPYGDLNLAIRADQKQLRGRIFNAANDICGPALGYDLRDHLQENCVNDAVDSTRSQVSRAIRRAKLQMAGHAVGPPVAIAMAVGVR